MSTVLMLCKGYPPTPGGVETYSEQVAIAYQELGMDVTVVTQSEGAVGWRPNAGGRVGPRVYNTGAGGQLRTALKLAKVTRSLLAHQSFDVVHATTWRPAVVLRKLHNTPLVITVHGREVFKVPRALRPLMKFTLQRATVVSTVSHATLERCRRAGIVAKKLASHWLVASNGISFPQEANEAIQRNDAPHLRVLTLARLVERKNIAACIDAIAELVTIDRIPIVYQIAGTGPLLGALKHQVDQLGLQGVVKVLGYVPESDVANLYRWADVFLHPQVDKADGADFEGFGLSIADAMSFGCAAIAGTGSGPSDFVHNMETGILVDGTNSSAIKESLRELATDPDLRARLAKAGRAYVVKNLSWESHASLLARSALSTTRRSDA